MLKALGFWPEKYDEFGPPDFIVDYDFDKDLKEKIIGYLESGEEFFSWLGFSFCRFRCDVRDDDMGCKDLTDGEWIWPEGLSHYVKEHNIGLPPLFIKHLMDRNFNASVPEDRKEELERIKGDFTKSGVVNVVDASVWNKWLKAKGEKDFLSGKKIGKREVVLDVDVEISLDDLLGASKSKY
jgi:hypothetical protein